MRFDARGLILLGCFLLHDVSGADAEPIFWEDAAGDVKPWSNAPDRPRPDLIRVDAEAAGGALKVTLTFKEPLQKIFDYTDAEGNKYAGTLLEMFIDSDNSPATGGKPTWWKENKRPLEGYDFMVSIALGYSFKNREFGGEGWAAGDTVLNINKVDILQGFGKFGVSKMKQGGEGTDFSNRISNMTDQELLKRTTIAGEKLAIEIPYEWMDLKAGGTVRICIKDYQEGAASGANITDDRLVTLK